MARKRKGVTRDDISKARFPKSPVTGGKMTLGTPKVAVKGGRRKKPSNRQPGERGLQSKRKETSAVASAATGSRNAASAERSRSSAT
ncbi:MAG: hypothetical protein E6Q97_16075 [Desulfurellales bacterium]|nr:MAG: hypothetical protein E6Q97_16075 [Desulfurellales bacterium]